MTTRLYHVNGYQITDTGIAGRERIREHLHRLFMDSQRSISSEIMQDADTALFFLDRPRSLDGITTWKLGDERFVAGEFDRAADVQDWIRAGWPQPQPIIRDEVSTLKITYGSERGTLCAWGEQPRYAYLVRMTFHGPELLEMPYSEYLHRLASGATHSEMSRLTLRGVGWSHVSEHFDPAALIEQAFDREQSRTSKTS